MYFNSDIIINLQVVGLSSSFNKEESGNFNKSPKHVKLEPGGGSKKNTRNTFEVVKHVSENTKDQKVSQNTKFKTDQDGDPLALLGKNVLIDPIPKEPKTCKKEIPTFMSSNEYQCNSCDFKCYVLSDLKNHKYTHGGKQFSCDLCDYNSPSNGEVLRHKKRRHLEKSISCDQCEYATCAFSFLRAHKRAKHDDIAYNCDQCKLTFISVGGLRRHEQRIHLGVIFTCQECEKQFSTRERLQVHVKAVHEGVTFACEAPDCDYITSRKFNLQKHTKKTHAQSTVQ